VIRAIAQIALVITVLPLAALAQSNDTQILEGSDQAGGIKLGAKIKSSPGLRELGDDLYETADGGLQIGTDGRNIVEIRALEKSYFTQKLIRPQESTLGDVLETYGEPTRVCSRDGKFAATFGQRPSGVQSGRQRGEAEAHLVFQSSYRLTGPLRDADLEALLGSRVELVALYSPQDYAVSFEQGYEFHGAERWERLAEAMERTLCDQPEGDPPRRVCSYGMKVLDYIPHFYLGLAWQKLGRCEEALAAWQKSEEVEGIRDNEAKYRQIQEGRSLCAGSGTAR
jgi:hypothetical protein